MGTLLDWLFDDDLVAELERPAHRADYGEEGRELLSNVYARMRLPAGWGALHRVTTCDAGELEPGERMFRTSCSFRFTARGPDVVSIRAAESCEVPIHFAPGTQIASHTSASITNAPSGKLCKRCFPMAPPHKPEGRPSDERTKNHGKKKKQPKEEDRSEGETGLGEGSLSQGEPTPEAKVKP